MDLVNPNTNAVQTLQGQIQSTESQSLTSHAVLLAFKSMNAEHDLAIDDLEVSRKTGLDASNAQQKFNEYQQAK